MFIVVAEKALPQYGCSDGRLDDQAWLWDVLDDLPFVERPDWTYGGPPAAKFAIPPQDILGHGEVAGANTKCSGKHFPMARMRSAAGALD